MKKKEILSFSIFLILIIAIAVYCWPVSKTWFPDREKLELVEVFVYDREITDLLTDEQKDDILDLLEGLETRRTLKYSSSFPMNDYPVYLHLWYAVGSSEMDTCELLLGKSHEIWSIGKSRLYRIVDGAELEAQLTELLAMYYE